MLHNLTGRVLPAGINPIYRQSLLFLLFCLSHSLCNSSCVSAERAWVLWSTGVISPATFEKCPVNALKPECSISPRRKCQKVLSLLQNVSISRLHLMNFYEWVWNSVTGNISPLFPTSSASAPNVSMRSPALSVATFGVAAGLLWWHQWLLCCGRSLREPWHSLLLEEVLFYPQKYIQVEILVKWGWF